MKAAKIGRLAPDWLWTYAGVILLVSILVNLATSLASYTPNLTLPAMRDSLRLSYTQVGVLVTGAGVVRMASSLAFGTLAPRYGSRAIIGVATIGTGAAMLFLGAAPAFSVALVAMALVGFASGGALTPMMGSLSPWFHIRVRGLAAGLAATGGSVAFVAAGVVVPWLTDRSPTEGWRHTWYIFGVVVLIVGVLALSFLRDHSQATSRPPHPAATPPTSLGTWPLVAYRSPAVWLVTALAFCSGWSQGIFSTFFGSYLSQEHGIPLAVVGRLLVLMGLLSLASGVLWGRASDHLGRSPAFLLSFLLQGLAYAMFWLMPALGPLVVSSVLMGLTLRAGYTICAAAAGDYIPPQFSAAAFGLMSVGAGLGSSISPVLAGVIADATGTLGWGFAQAVAGAAVGIAGSFLLRRSHTRQSPA